MWKQGGRSLALDRAQALLSSKRHDRGGAGSYQESAAKTRTQQDDGDGSVITKSVPPAQTFLSDLSDLSSVSSAPEHEAAPAWRAEGRSNEPNRDVRPQSSLGGGGGGSRFLKKAPPPSANSSQEPEPRYVSSSQRGYQNAALSRLDQIESRIRSHKQAQERNRQGSKPSEIITSDLNVSSLPYAKSLETPVQLSAQPSSDQDPSGKRFLKKATAANAAATSPGGPESAVRSVSRAADVVFPLAGWAKKPGRVVSGVSLESDEEDMKKLLGDSLDSMDSSFLKPGRPSSARTTDKTLGKSRSKVHSTPPHASSAPSPASPSHRSSPFRFTGQAQAHFSPSALSPSPSPPHIAPSPPRRLDYSHRAASPERSLSSMSGHSQVMSLEELFPVRSHAEVLQSDISEVSSEADFKINVMTLDDLAPADPGFTEDAADKETKAERSPPEHLPRLKEEEKGEQQLQEEYAEDYQSDFENESRTEPDHSASQVSEHLQALGDEEEIVSEVVEKTAGSDVSRGRTEDDYSSSFSDTSRSHSPHTANQSRTYRRSTDSRSSRSTGSQASRSRRRSSSEKVLKDSAARTQPDPLPHLRPAGLSTLGPAVGAAYMHPGSAIPQTVGAEMVEALSTFNPAAFALNEILKQHLAMTRRFIEANRDLHFRLMKSLDPPNYRYTTLEDTKEYIRKQRPPKLTVEEALEDVMREMKDHHHI